MKLPRKEIREIINEGRTLQVACSYSNVCRWNYLTTSGKVCCEDYGFEEDTDPDEDGETRIDLPKMTWSTVKRLQRALSNLQM